MFLWYDNLDLIGNLINLLISILLYFIPTEILILNLFYFWNSNPKPILLHMQAYFVSSFSLISLKVQLRSLLIDSSVCFWSAWMVKIFCIDIGKGQLSRGNNKIGGSSSEVGDKDAMFSSSRAMTKRKKAKSISGPNNNNNKRESRGQYASHGGHEDEEVCLICMDAKPAREFFRNGSCSCSRSFCNDCVGKYIAAKIHENVSTVECPEPECQRLLEPKNCRCIVPKRVFDRWQIAICEAHLGEKKFYCPFKDCSALLLDEDLTVSECPNCLRFLCARCKVPWHNGIECDEFQKLGKEERGREDLMVMELAKMNNWRRCPTCKIYVERRSGCLLITCR